MMADSSSPPACVRIWRHINSSKGLEELCQCEELLLHSRAVSLHTPDQTPICLLKEHHGYLAPQVLSLMCPVLPPGQGLVLCNVENH